jgi:hypothetical protein
VNRFGLSRDIPNETKRLIRQRCGFGCVVCGSAFYQYEHVAPNFADARVHDPERIALLCGSCHDRVTRGALSKQTVQECALRPKAKELGFSFGPFDIGLHRPVIVAGTLTGRMTGALIEINGESVISILAPESEGGPFRIYANLRDRNGSRILGIDDNEWKTPATNWDVEVVGPRISVRRAARDISLVLRSEPPGRIVIELLEMQHLGTKIRCVENENIEVTTRQGRTMRSGCVTVEECAVGILVTDDALMLGVGGAGPGKVLIEQAEFRGPGWSGPLIISNSTFIGTVHAVVRIGESIPPVARQASEGPIRKIGKNDPCYCGSGKKYKRCHGG